MKRDMRWLKTLFFLAVLTAGFSAQVSACCCPSGNCFTASVDAGAGPWDPSINPGFNYGVHDQSAPLIVDASYGLSFAPGTIINVRYLDGLVQAGSGWPAVDADGDSGYVANGNTGSSGKYFPSRYTPPDWDTNLMALVGTFADSNGDIVDSPFEIGTLVSLTVPLGADHLQLGLNDDIFRDNIGAFRVEVCGPAVPLPGAVWLLGAGLLSVIGIKRKCNHAGSAVLNSSKD